MNTLDCIKQRMSIRSFTDRQVEREKLDIIVEAGLQAPTAMNSRDITLTVVCGDKVAILNSLMEKAMDESLLSHFYNDKGKFEFHRGGKALIVVSLGKKAVLPEQNTGCIMENMYLAATELGLGACWINQFYSNRSPEINSFLRLGDELPYAALSVGYIESVPPKKERDGKVIFVD